MISPTNKFYDSFTINTKKKKMESLSLYARYA